MDQRAFNQSPSNISVNWVVIKQKGLLFSTHCHFNRVTLPLEVLP